MELLLTKMSDDRVDALERRVAALESVDGKKKRKPKVPKSERPPPKGRAKFMSEQMPLVREAWVKKEHQVKDAKTGEMRPFKQPDVMSECSRLWRELSDEEKAKY